MLKTLQPSFQIAPSPHDQSVIWVGTDDGNLQLTRDGGKTWNNLASRLPSYATGSWIPQIEVSPHNKGEVFVVVNDYRRNNYQPYIYHTADFGNTWKRLADGNSVKGHCHSIVQDLVEPDLLFLGTEYGLYFSINKGSNWQKWKAFPSVPTIDMKIHPREHDLIIGTFGRAAWIMDDIRPLREIAKTKGKVLKQEFALFDAPDVYLANYRSVDGVRFNADGGFVGDNKSRSARISMWVKPKKKKKKKKEEEKIAKGKKGKKGKKSRKGGKGGKGEDMTSDLKMDKKEKKGGKKVFIVVYDEKGDTVRNYSVKPDTALTKISWGMDRNGVRFPSHRDPRPDANPPRGGRVLPGKYKLVATFGDFKDSTYITVLADPRIDFTIAEMEAQQKASFEFYTIVGKATKAFNQLKGAKKTIKLVNDQMVNAPDSTQKSIKKLGKEMQDSITMLQNLFTDQPDLKGIQRNPNTLNSSLFTASRYIRASDGAPNQMAQFATKKATIETEKVLNAVNKFFAEDWADYERAVEDERHSVFKKYEQIEIDR